MRKVHTTATAHFRRKRLNPITDKQAKIFSCLHNILEVYEDKLEVKVNEKYHYELWTNRGYRPKSLHLRSTRGIAFATIMIFKKYVGLYFLPLSNGRLNGKISPELQTFKKGTYTFHFDDLLELSIERKIGELIAEGWALYKAEGLVKTI